MLIDRAAYHGSSADTAAAILFNATRVTTPREAMWNMRSTFTGSARRLFVQQSRCHSTACPEDASLDPLATAGGAAPPPPAAVRQSAARYRRLGGAGTAVRPP